MVRPISLADYTSSILPLWAESMRCAGGLGDDEEPVGLKEQLFVVALYQESLLGEVLELLAAVANLPQEAMFLLSETEAEVLSFFALLGETARSVEELDSERAEALVRLARRSLKACAGLLEGSLFNEIEGVTEIHRRSAGEISSLQIQLSCLSGSDEQLGQ